MKTHIHKHIMYQLLSNNNISNKSAADKSSQSQKLSLHCSEIK